MQCSFEAFWEVLATAVVLLFEMEHLSVIET